VGTATARDGGGVGFSGFAACSSSARGAGVFLGFGVSSSFGASFVVFLVLRAVSFSRGFFFADFGLGVGVWCRFDFGEALGSGVSRGVGSGVFSVSADFPDSSPTSFARGMALGAFSGVGDGRCLFVDLPVAFLAAGLGDFFGFGDDAACVSLWSD
jgi:hypothetical protein